MEMIAVIVLIGLVGGGLQVWKHGSHRRWIGRLRRASAIGSRREGVVKLQGRVVAAEALIRAPLSGAACVFYGIDFTCVGDNAKHPGRRHRGVWFIIEDGTGEALVRFDGYGSAPSLSLDDDGPPGVRYAIPATVKWGPGDVDIGRPDVQAVLAGAGMATTQAGLVIAESLILPGDTVSVIGHALVEIDAGAESGGYREARDRYVVTHRGRRPLVIVREQTGPAHGSIYCSVGPAPGSLAARPFSRW
jgi:hypothetical protein